MRLPFVPPAALGAAALFGAAVGVGLLGVTDSGPIAVLCAAGALICGVIALLTPPPVPPPLPASLGTGQPRGDAGGRVSIEALAYPVVIIDSARRIAQANREARALLGERVLGEDVRIALRHPAILEAEAAARAGTPQPVHEIQGFQHSESVFRVRAAPLGDERVLLGFVDVTQARLAERMRVDFVANASHELRTPLSTLLGFIETLQGPAAQDEPARQRFLDIMQREAQRMSRLIDDLLSLSRIELDKYVPPRGRVSLPGVANDVIRALTPRLERDQRSVQLAIADDLPDVTGDRDQLVQVLHNLVSNALKYGRRGTPIRISAELDARLLRSGQAVRLSVEDEGDGIAAEHIPRLTERFYRVDTSRSRAVGGTGLGLAIVKHIVERHRGELSISSRLGVGTTVSVLLPCAEGPPATGDAGDPDGEDEGSLADPQSATVPG